MSRTLKIIYRSLYTVKFLNGYENCIIIITPQNFRTLLLDHIYTTKKGELRCGLEDELKSRNIILYDKNFIEEIKAKALEEEKICQQKNIK